MHAAVAFPLLCVVQLFHMWLQIDIPLSTGHVLFLDRGLWVAATALYFVWLCVVTRAPTWLLNVLVGSTLVGIAAFFAPDRLLAVPLLWLQQAALFVGLVYWLATDWQDKLSRWLLGVATVAHGLGFTMLFTASQILAPAEFFGNPAGQYIVDVAFGSIWPAALFFGTASAAWVIPARRAWLQMRPEEA
jgi:hypothetical protein